ncbi:MAG: PLP-dependent transferase [Verrucomicrobiota bacterium]
MRDPFAEPFSRKQDLGLALPESEHAVSVCLPTWRDVIGYEEGEDRVIEAMECGYPRFVPHPVVAELFIAASEEFAKSGEIALVFPSLGAAWRCAEYVKRRSGASGRLESYGWNDLTAILIPDQAYDAAWKYWQHSGEIVSSRHAEAALTDAPLPGEIEETGAEARRVLRERIASFYEETDPDGVFLFSSGMAAVSAVHRVFLRRREGEPTVQVEFPYLDSLKVQEQFGEAIDFSVTASGGVEEFRDWQGAGNRAAAIFTEVPSNPLLRTADLAGLSALAGESETPLAIDDTVATCINVDALRFGDVVTTSLTKTFSGAGNVAAGAVVVKRDSLFAGLLREEMALEEAASPLFAPDAIVLEQNSRHFAERVQATNEVAEVVLGEIGDRREVERLWFPSTECRSYYDEVRRDGGGYGALFSMRLAGGERGAASFYDALRISKGPSLGTNFSLCCPYTLLAHYGELDWAEARGAERNLVRLWIGLEDPEELVARLEEALEATS